MLALLPDWLDARELIDTVGLVGTFLVVFAESGLLIGFFLPGDALLFTAGFFASSPSSIDESLHLPLVPLVLGIWFAAIAGDQVGYVFGQQVGPALFKRPDSRFFKQANVDKAHEFFERHGRKTIVIEHFVGVVRSFTPLIAGASGMRYPVFLTYDVIGAVGWGVGLVVVGYHLGAIPFVGAHLELAVLAIACLSVLPVAVSAARALLARREAVPVDGDAPPAELTAGPTSAT